MIEKENTTNLMDELSSSRRLAHYLAKHDYDHCGYLSFVDYLDQLMQEKHIKKSILIRKINMTRSYAYEIFNGYKHPSRDKTILITFGLKLDFKSTQKLLICAGHNPLHPKDRRDAVLIYAKFNHHSLAETNLLLDDFQEAVLL